MSLFNLNQLKSDSKFHPAGLAGNPLLGNTGFLPLPSVTGEFSRLTGCPENRGRPLASHPSWLHWHAHGQALCGLEAVHDMGVWGWCSSARLGAQVPSPCPQGVVISLKCPAPSSGAARTGPGPLQLGHHQPPSLTRAGHFSSPFPKAQCMPAIIQGFRELQLSRETDRGTASALLLPEAPPR